jgi:hypothetical protein
MRHCSSSSACSYVITVIHPRRNEHAANGARIRSLPCLVGTRSSVSRSANPQDPFIRVVANEDVCLSRNEHWISRVCRYDRALKVHPDAEIYLSLPGLATVLGAWALAEFGDDPNRYKDGRARKNYAGTSPITQASGRTRVVLARFVRNDRLADVCQLWAFAAISASPGARRYYDALRARKKGHHAALRMLANRLVGILHGCLRHRQLYREDAAWPSAEVAAA